ncbi:MAG: GatB/YqeY domain-containing protein [Actinomycetota bacterium]|nr:GatB/YqeY domain-containing protein [Actinomycetota bacterium]
MGDEATEATKATKATDLEERLAAEIRTALKSGQKVRLAALRLLSSSVHNREVELRRPLTEEEFREVVGREVRRRGESIEAYERGGREELAAREREERDVLSAYLPPQLSEEEVDALVDEAIAATGATDLKEMGKVMGHVMGRAKGKVDGSAVQARVRARLGELGSPTS